MGKYRWKNVITQTLTEPPEAYSDAHARNQPHVQVALRLKRSGYVTGCSAGDAVPYIICCQEGNVSTSSVGIAQRARHPDELKGGNESWIIDIDYYLAQQIHPMISRLCESIQGTSPSRLADCLGLDPSKGCEPLILSCRRCSSSFECSPILHSVSTLTIQSKNQAGSS